jgi:hypothetical protein
VTSIGDLAFYGCSSLMSVVIGDGVTSIGWSAFEDCSKLQYNEYGNVKYLGTADNPYYALIAPVSTNILSCVMHSGVELIANDAFDDCTDRVIEVTKDCVVDYFKKDFGYGSENLEFDDDDFEFDDKMIKFPIYIVKGIIYNPNKDVMKKVVYDSIAKYKAEKEGI